MIFCYSTTTIVDIANFELTISPTFNDLSQEHFN